MSLRCDLITLALAVGMASTPSNDVIAQEQQTRCHGCFAVVSANGDRVRHRDAPLVRRLATGQYLVRFRLPIIGCYWQASIGLGSFFSTVLPGAIAVAGQTGTDDRLLIHTRNQHGVFADRPFHVVTTC